MHDSRNIENDIIESGPVRSRADGKWKHDRFDERSQRPKSRRELVNRYGFDIRYEVLLKFLLKNPQCLIFIKIPNFY